MGTWENHNDGKPNFPYLEKENPYAPGTKYKDALELISNEEIAKRGTDEDTNNLVEKGIHSAGWWLVIRHEQSTGNVTYVSEQIANFKVSNADANIDGGSTAYEILFQHYVWSGNTASSATIPTPASGNTWVNADLDESAFQIATGSAGFQIATIAVVNPTSGPTLIYLLQSSATGKKWIDYSASEAESGKPFDGITLRANNLSFWVASDYNKPKRQFRWKITGGDDTIYTPEFSILPISA